MAATLRPSTLAALVCALVVPVGLWAPSAATLHEGAADSGVAAVSAAAHAQQPNKPARGKTGTKGKKGKKATKAKKAPKKPTLTKIEWSPAGSTEAPSATASTAPTPITSPPTLAPSPRTAPTPTPIATPEPAPTSVPTPAPPPVPTFALMKDRSGNVPRWNPCAGPITVKLSTPGLAAADQPAAEAELVWAIGQLAETTGLNFSYAGRTTEVAAMSTKMTTAQIVVSYASTAQSPLLAMDPEAAGFGGSWMSGPNRSSGFAVINTDTTNDLARTFDGGVTRSAVLLHEMGHVMGLDHVESEAELMGAWLSPNSPATFAAGDRQGLVQLGATQGCTR